MTRIALLALLLPALANALKASLEQTPISEWQYFPPGAKIGIVTAGTPDVYKNFNYGSKDATLMLKYAQRHGYAFIVDKNWGRLSSRRKGWNKVVLLHKLLPEVETLVWMDADMIIKDLDKPMEQLMTESKCDGSKQQWNLYLPKRANNQTFIWMNADVSPHRHLVNANSAMIILKRTPEAFKLLEDVWDVGRNDTAFLRHSDATRFFHKEPTSTEYGWPFEQGAFWDVMAHNPDVNMKGACITPDTTLHSVRPYMYQDGIFALHMGGMTDQLRREQSQLMLSKAGGKVEIH